MGISTIQSYNGAQIFEAVGLAPDLIERHFTGTASRIGGIGLDVLARETLDAPPARLSRGVRAAAGRRDLRLAARRRAAPVEPAGDRQAPAGGAPRRSPELRRVGGGDERGDHAPRVAARAARAALRRRPASPLDEVEPASEIVKRFATGAMSLGLALARGARDARDRDEPDRRQVQHRRGRGGRRALRARSQRRLAPLGDQAGRVRPLRRDGALPHERRRDPDQDGPGREARRGRPAARPQGRRLHRQASAPRRRASA